MTIGTSLNPSVSIRRNIARTYRRINSKLSELLITTVAGEPATNDEEGGHSNEEQEALIKEQEKEGWWLPRPGCYGRHDQGR